MSDRRIEIKVVTNPTAYMVVTGRGVFGVWFDREEAHAAARAVEAAVVELPIAADYREDSS